MRFTESMNAAYLRGHELSEAAHRGLSADARTGIAAAELSDVGVDQLLSQNFVATLPPPPEILAQYEDDEQIAFFAGWLDGASGSSRYRASVEAAQQLTMNF